MPRASFFVPQRLMMEPTDYFGPRPAMSAFSGKADMELCSANFCF